MTDLNLKKDFSTLKRHVRNITMLAFLATGVLTAISAGVLFVYKRGADARDGRQGLVQSAPHQIEKLVPGLMLAEQKVGIQLFIDKVKEIEGLTEIKVLEGAAEIPPRFLNCEWPEGEITYCVSEDEKELASIIPIRESDINLGYLFKSKLMDVRWTSTDLFWLFVIFLVWLGISFVLAHIFIAKVFSRRVSEAIDGMAKWIEASLANEEADLPPLPFQDLEQLKFKVTEIIYRLNESRNEAIMAELAAQVSHDLKSPLAALQVIANNITELPETKRALIKTAIGRIREITESMLRNYKKALSVTDASLSAQHLSQQSIARLATEVLDEKCIQYTDRPELKFELCTSCEASGLVEPTEFRRMLSNLLDNSAQAIEAEGKVVILLDAVDQKIKLSVVDNGKGIEPEVLKVLGSKGVTRGKKDGSGLGIYHLKRMMMSWGGSMEIFSEVGSGTVVNLYIPESSERQEIRA